MTTKPYTFWLLTECLNLSWDVVRYVILPMLPTFSIDEYYVKLDRTPHGRSKYIKWYKDTHQKIHFKYNNCGQPEVSILHLDVIMHLTLKEFLLLFEMDKHSADILVFAIICLQSSHTIDTIDIVVWLCETYENPLDIPDFQYHSSFVDESFPMMCYHHNRIDAIEHLYILGFSFDTIYPDDHFATILFQKYGEEIDKRILEIFTQYRIIDKELYKCIKPSYEYVYNDSKRIPYKNKESYPDNYRSVNGYLAISNTLHLYHPQICEIDNHYWIKLS